MSRPVYLARTAHDLDHVNRIGLMTFGLVDFRLGIGTKTSKFYVPEGAVLPKGGDEFSLNKLLSWVGFSQEDDKGSDEFHFVPELENAELRYEIDDLGGLVTGLKLEVFTRFETDPIWTLDFDKLGSDWWSHGKHVIKWDGRVVKAEAEQKGTEKADGVMEHDLTQLTPDKTDKDKFPDGYVSLEFTPFKFRLTLLSKDNEQYGSPVWGWTYWQILLHSLELDLAPEEAIPAAVVDDTEHKRHKAVHAQVKKDGKVPKDGETRKVKLVSNIFKTSSGEMGTSSTYSEYETMWGDGPKIPLIAKIRLKDSNDAEVKLEESAKGAVSVGNARFLWDWEDPAEDTATRLAVSVKARTFVNQAINYKKAATDESPKGDNCHVDKGGKRGPAAKPIFPVQAGYDPKDTLESGKFPFKVEATEKRKWAAFSRGWGSGELKGRTGVLFQPSRMAGDDYVLSVYLSTEKSEKDKYRLDNKDEKLKAADAIKKKTGAFQIWRELQLVKYVRKKSSIADFLSSNLGAIQANYQHAFVEVEAGAVVKEELAVPNYNALARNCISAAGSIVVTLGVDPAADHASTSAAFLVRDHAGLRARVLQELQALNPTLSAAQLGPSVDTWMTNNKVATAQAHSYKMDELLRQPAKQLADDVRAINGAADGITIVHFDCPCQLRQTIDAGGILGSAIDVAGASRNKCCFVLFASATDTFVHEIGHHLFLAHFGPKPDTFDAVYHDATDLACIMSYNRPRPAFCGFCILRLRGWNSDQLSKNGAGNSA